MNKQRQSLIKPPRLCPGDVIGIAAPAGPFEIDLFERGVAAIEKMGFEVLVPAQLQKPTSYLAGSDAHRASMLNDLLRAQDVHAIVCARGGYGSIRILERIDFDLLRRNPKVIIGFSDISAILSALIFQNGLVAYHGPVVTTLGHATSQTRAAFMDAVASDQALSVKPQKSRVVWPGKATGLVAGGNLTTLCHLLGTPYSPNFKDCILVMEDTGEAPYRIDRMLVQMKMAGCLEGVSGIVLGSFKDCGRHELIDDIVKHFFSDQKIPVLGGFDIGHGRHNFTIPLGIQATLDTEQGHLQYHEAATLS